MMRATLIALALLAIVSGVKAHDTPTLEDAEGLRVVDGDGNVIIVPEGKVIAFVDEDMPVWCWEVIPYQVEQPKPCGGGLVVSPGGDPCND